jgi:hypothetical protein
VSETQTYSIAANLRWFAGVYGAVAISAVALRLLVDGSAIETPLRAMQIAADVSVVALAGHRFAARNPNWTGKDRHYLALGYTLTIALIAATTFGLLLLLKPLTTPFPQGDAELYLSLAAASAVMLMIIYAIVRVVLTFVKIVATKQLSGGIQA